MVNILVVGNDARTHAVVEALIISPQKPKIFAYMAANNPGIAELSAQIQLGSYDDLESINTFAEVSAIDFAFIGPEYPLSKGVVDSLEKINIKSVGPIKELAQLETSKSFTRLLQQKYNVPGLPKFKVFESKDGLQEFIETLDAFVVKPDGLTGGKGIKVQGDHFNTKEEGIKEAESVLKDHPAVVIEEKLIGQEFSLQSLTDGKTLLDFPPVQDHKRAFVGDKGPNTGGMGSYSTGPLLPFMTEQDLKDAHEITLQMAKAIKEETGHLYKGVMYGGFICTKDGVKLIEYNARFGDPEAMNILPVLKTDFVKICQAVIAETLDQIQPEFSNDATVCKYAVPDGYPDKPVANKKVDISEVDRNARIYYASVEKKDNKIYMTKSRALAFVGIAPSIKDAEVIAENAVSSVKGPVFHREDIGTKELIDKRIKHMEELRS
ncbi:MAG: phosphoribosylamine--glycine ligase [Candidatus Woesearchaeota archaeon]|jgi:phosphoribosylamine--glycine ligase|nr:phosphoribosylamine--glycine ligase [Candidatus Woesearchaeota archaeon]